MIAVLIRRLQRRRQSANVTAGLQPAAIKYVAFSDICERQKIKQSKLYKNRRKESVKTNKSVTNYELRFIRLRG